MKIKNVKLEWYVINYDINAKAIKHYNVFFTNMIETIHKKYKKEITTIGELENHLKREFMYYYWGKREAEIAVGDLCARTPDDLEKIDIWWQLEPNLKIITDYVNTTLDMKLTDKPITKTEQKGEE